MRILVCLTCSLALLTGCSSDDSPSSAGDTTASTATTSTAAPTPTTTEPEPTITADFSDVSPTTAGEVSASSAVATPTSTVTGSTIKTPLTTTPTTTKPAATTAPQPVPEQEYEAAVPPVVPEASTAVPIDNSHPDGVYYATPSEGGDPLPANGAVVFELVQLFIGQDCIDHFGIDDPDACVNDYGIETDPTSFVEVDLTKNDIYITVVDAATQQSFQISGPELYDLIQGDIPSEEAPEEYLYSGFGYFLTFENGDVTRLEQWFTP